jgi:hypothetical protein
MSDLQKNWIAPILTGLIATVLGGLMLLPLVSPAKMDEAPTGVALKDNSNSVFPTLLAPQWEPLANEASYARNYSRLAKLPYERFPQVVTIYETPMATDRRNGREISPGEYVEIFKVGEPTDVVILVRLDKGRYWLLSRQRISLSLACSVLN